MPSSPFKIVCVVTETTLIDSDSTEHVYWRRDGKPLAPGHYVVSWPPGTSDRRFKEDAVFRGPYRGHAEAVASLQELKAAGSGYRWRGHAVPPALVRRP